MKQFLHIKIMAAGIAALICLVWAGCAGAAGDGGDDDGGIYQGSAWKMVQATYRCTEDDAYEGNCTEGELVTTDMPITEIFDLDGDESDETFRTDYYLSLDNGIAQYYIGLGVTDPGPDTTTLAYYGYVDGIYYCPDDAFTYTVSGTTYTDAYGNAITVEIDGDNMTITNPDDTDEVETYVKVNITASEQCYEEKKVIRKPLKSFHLSAFSR